MGPHPELLPGKSHGQRSLVGCSPWGCEKSETTEPLHFHALEREMATHSSVLAWRIPATGESMGSHRVGHDWSDLAAAAAAAAVSDVVMGMGQVCWVIRLVSGLSQIEEGLPYTFTSMNSIYSKELPMDWPEESWKSKNLWFLIVFWDQFTLHFCVLSLRYHVVAWN